MTNVIWNLEFMVLVEFHGCGHRWLCLFEAMLRCWSQSGKKNTVCLHANLLHSTLSSSSLWSSMSIRLLTQPYETNMSTGPWHWLWLIWHWKGMCYLFLKDKLDGWLHKTPALLRTLACWQWASFWEQFLTEKPVLQCKGLHALALFYHTSWANEFYLSVCCVSVTKSRMW